jgi:flagellar protein FliS
MSYGPPQPPAHAYLQRQLEQASPHQAMLLLLDGMIKFVLQAKDAISRRDIQGRYNATQRARDILTFLISHHDETKGEAAIRLLRIYGALMGQLIRIDFDNDAAQCDAVIANVRNLRQGFASLQPASNVVAAPTASNGEAPLPVKLAASA